MADRKFISCCCSNGFGSSMIVAMNVQKVLKQMGVTDIQVRHVPLAESGFYRNDLFIVGLDISPQMRSFRQVIVLHDLMSKAEIEQKLRQAFSFGDEAFWIE